MTEIKELQFSIEIPEETQKLLKDVKEAMELSVKALAPLVAIADAYDANELDNEARRFWGIDNQNEETTPHDQIELYSGRGGKRLLTLEDCMFARRVVRGDGA